MSSWPLFFLACLTLVVQPFKVFAADPGPNEYDIVIYGNTSAAVAAAVQAERMGKSVVIVAPSTHLGGMSSSGLGRTDGGNTSLVGGLAREFYRRVQSHYEAPESWKRERAEDYEYFRPGDDAMWNFEPHVAEAVFEALIEEHAVPVFRNEWLDREKGVETAGERIIAIEMHSGKKFHGKMFVDATYEGDLMAAAGISYVVGREGNAKYSETLNGSRVGRHVAHNQFLLPVDPYVTPGDPSSGLVCGVQSGDPAELGTRDSRLQAYCYRLCLTDAVSNRVTIEKPDEYDESEYELLFRNFEAGDHRLPLHNARLPNRKTDTNNSGAFSTDAIGLNYAYPEASYREREKILAAHEKYQKGLLWTLANHSRVPLFVRREAARWGLAKDEFVDNANWPHQIYVRESRRMVSDYVQTEHDCLRRRVCDDSIGCGSYGMDSHNVQRYVDANGHVKNEGEFWVGNSGYAISYRAIVPRKGETENLLVPVCLSASHAAYGSIRMEPVFMILGQSAATAAVLAIEDNVALQELDYSKLRQRLLVDGQILDSTGDAH